MKQHLQEIEDDQDILILSGPKKRHYGILTLEQFNSMEETAHLRSTPANTARLMESIAQYRAGKVKIRETDKTKKPVRSTKRKSTPATKKA